MPLGQLDDDIGIQVVVSPSLPGLHHYQESPGGQWDLLAPDTDTDEGGQSDLLFFTSEPPVFQSDLLFLPVYQSDLLPALSLLLLLLVVVAKPNLLKHFVHSMYHQTRWFGKYRQLHQHCKG